MRTGRPKLAEPLVIGEWWKNRRGESIRVRLSTYEGHNLFDVRTWFPKDGKLLPGKGFCCHTKHLPKLVSVLEKALVQARERGLINADDEGADE
ncbi:MAG TPA: transcriptional coactivator p15/PC4 family protein [Xanthobacteraceae bacterium]|jgi:hypothetical protein|nr:transcriptional coactivator p15/PC4 family protein [Xanthobacteraceae bacterium]